MKIPPFPLVRGGALALLATLALPAFALDKSPPPDDYAQPTQQGGNDRVSVMSNNYVGPDEKIAGNVVAVMGNNVVDGTVGHDVVTVMGNAVINGTVGHNVVATMGNIVLGPHAVVGGDVVAAGGRVQRAPSAICRGRVVGTPIGRMRLPFRPGRNAFAPRIPWLRGWSPAFPVFCVVVSILMIISVGFSTLLALVFPRGIRRCGDMLAERPGITVLTAFITLLALPMLFILLCITVIGIPVAILFLPLGILAADLFGKASVYGFIGRSVCRDRLHHPALAVLLGGILCGLFFLIPFVGLMVSIALSILGLGCVVSALLMSWKPAAAAVSPPEPAAQASPPPAAAVSAPLPAVVQEPPPIAAPPGSPPPAAPPVAAPLISSTLPRAGFWVRIGALLIDALIIALFAHLWFLAIAVYAAVLWKLRGATIGGIVFGLQVVRLDDRPIEWETAIMRALGCFLSAIVFGLGFLWIAFDSENQAWHDKIAGTIVVRVKGKSLV